MKIRGKCVIIYHEFENKHATSIKLTLFVVKSINQ